MTATRSTQEEKNYNKYRKTAKSDACPFCAINKGHEQYITETKHLKVIRNRTPYSLWDGQGVLEHLMVIPKVHTDSLKDLHGDAANEYVDLLSSYELQGYNVYARAQASSVRSVVHQHTHLIKTDGRSRSFLFMLRRPFYVRMSR